jgi:hypothetical protein
MSSVVAAVVRRLQLVLAITAAQRAAVQNYLLRHIVVRAEFNLHFNKNNVRLLSAKEIQ